MKTITLTLALCVLSFFTAEVYGQNQDSTLRSKEEKRLDSLVNVKRQQAEDQAKMIDLKDSQSVTKAKAKEAQRIEGEANDAANQSRKAYRAEKRAQKIRKQADKQAVKAAKSRDRSNKNSPNKT